jgi:muramoyltetrapeptide carboxypeptidase
MDLPTVHPKALKGGDTVAIIAPAGPSSNRQGLQQAIATLERLGFRVRSSERIFDSTRYLAGSDAARAEELMGAFEDPEVKAILPLRGGYGCARLIPLLDEKRLRPNCKIFMGYSDLTTLHLYFRRRFGWVTFHGPMALSTCLADLVPEQEQNLLSLLTDPMSRPSFCFPQLESWTPGTAEGKLIGGCLSLIVASIGTPYEIRTEGKILFLEEVEEPPYRLDRMFTQLRLAGKMDGLAGIILGSFLNCDAKEGNDTADDTIMEMVADKGFPVIANFPAGHVRDNWAFPLGVQALLNADTPRLDLLEPAVS